MGREGHRAEEGEGLGGLGQRGPAGAEGTGKGRVWGRVEKLGQWGEVGAEGTGWGRGDRLGQRGWGRGDG